VASKGPKLYDIKNPAT